VGINEGELEAGQRISNRLHERVPDDVIALHGRPGSLACMNYLAATFNLTTDDHWRALWAAFDLGAYMALVDVGLEN